MACQNGNGSPNGQQTMARSSAAPVPAANASDRYHPELIEFQRATKQDCRLRLGLCGPGGSGKSFTALKLASELGGRIAAVDTERGSLAKYSDLFEFDVLTLASFDPDFIPAAIASASKRGYSIIIIDSLSHFWTGTNGELDQVERAKLRMKDNSWAAWREVTPKHNRLIDAMLQAPLHVITTMRVKTAWVLETDERGKTRPHKVGLDPVMREGMEYEFDVVGDMDQSHNFVITKSRCPELDNRVFPTPGRELANILKGWLTDPKTTPAQKRMAEQRIEQLQAAATASSAAAPARPWRTMREMKQCFAHMREQAGETAYLSELDRAGVADPGQFKTINQAVECYNRLLLLVKGDS